jgi:hypothetical protein
MKSRMFIDESIVIRSVNLLIFILSKLINNLTIVCSS